MKVRFMISPHILTMMIMGMDFLLQHRATLDFSNMKLKFGGAAADLIAVTSGDFVMSFFGQVDRSSWMTWPAAINARFIERLREETAREGNPTAFAEPQRHHNQDFIKREGMYEMLEPQK